MTVARLAAATLSLWLMAGSATSQNLLTFEDLNGWAEDDHAQALSTFRSTCGDLKAKDWQTVCVLAKKADDARGFFEALFLPVLIGGEDDALFTGYYEPEIKAARQRGGPYQFPIYRKPPELRSGQVWLSRAEIDQSGVLENRGLEIAFAADPVEVFFLQIQGSGRLRLPDGDVIRVGFHAKNGHTYRSVGRELVRRGLFQAHQVSAQTIKRWVRQNGTAGQRLLHHNPSFVFFREVNRVPANKGPLGAMNRSITAGRSIAIDPAFTPLGAPVWIEKAGRDPMKRLMIAQDTGSAIKGAQRADIFYGTGDAAGREAGRIRDPGRLVVLLPIEMALSLTAGG